ncbi:hypothetical protein FRC12_002398 [Ceratobasidium sp. 428]|nr:hypothetical protein FRC12_002398 [Ceratobasidium sp. 428]
MRVKLRHDGEKMSVWGTVDGGAMLCVLNSTIWAQVEHRFGRLRESPVVCRMANGACVPSMGTGVGEVRYRQAQWPIRFEVIDSKGAFELLMGKDWLKLAGATQFYPSDTLSLRSQEETMYIDNENPKKKRPERRPRSPKPPTTNGTSTPSDDEHPPHQRTDNPTPATNESAPEASTEREITDPGEPVPRRSERLWARRGSTGENTNPFWVAETALAEVEASELLDVDEVQTLERPEELWAKARLESEAGTLRDVMHADEIKQDTRTNLPLLAEVLARARRNMERSRGPSDVAFTDAEPAARPKIQVHVPPIPDSD